MMRIIMAQHIKMFFWYSLVLIEYLILEKSVSKSLKFSPKWQFLYFKHIFCYHSNDKSKINARILHLGYSSNKQMGDFREKQLSIFVSKGGQFRPLMHVPLCFSVKPGGGAILLILDNIFKIEKQTYFMY